MQQRGEVLMAVKLFFCYAHEDEPLLNKLKTQLSPLRRQGLIEMWHDRDISAGTEWEEEIKQQLNTAQVILLLVSPDFMDSDYCYSIEMQRAIERHDLGEAIVIPVILRPVSWQEVFGKLQALPTDAKPIVSSSWHYQDEAFFNVTEGIRKAIKKIASRSSTHPPTPPVSPSLQQTKQSPQNYPHNQTFVAIDQPQLEQQQQLVIQNQVSSSPSQKPV
jgi:TIR domain-containing protein